MAYTEKKKIKGVNRSSDKKRFIKLQVNLSKFKKEWFTQGKDKADGSPGDLYANMTLMMLPDGEIDRYENLGMIVQDVPKAVYDQDKTVKGPILGNGAEYDWNAGAANDMRPGDEGDTPAANRLDDLPF